MGGETDALIAVVTWLYHFFDWLFHAPWVEIQPFVDRVVAYFILFVVFKFLWHWAFKKKFK